MKSMAPRLAPKTATIGQPELARLTPTPALAGAAAFVALELTRSARLGPHRDEPYFLACARHLAWGYTDEPPLVAADAWLPVCLSGISPTVVRVPPALADCPRISPGVSWLTGRGETS